MWVSDNTILKLAKVLHIDAYQLFEPTTAIRMPISNAVNTDEFILELEGRIIKFVKQQFEEAKNALYQSSNTKDEQ